MIMSSRFVRLAGGLATALLLSGTARRCRRPRRPATSHDQIPGLHAAERARVILAEDHRLPLVAVNLWYHVGPANEEPGRTGFAHLFEHMMFQGSKHVPRRRALQDARGAPARSDINGTTDFDRTNYFETLPSNQLELALWLESDRMGYLLDMLDQAQACRTSRTSCATSGGRASRTSRTASSKKRVVPPAVPEGPSVLRRRHRLARRHPGGEARGRASEFFKQYYAPNNASLAIVGDIDKAQAKALVEKYFGTLKRGRRCRRSRSTTPPITSERRAVVKDRVELPRVYMAWITPPIFKPGDADADIAATILGGGKSSRLYKKLVYEKQIAQDVTRQPAVADPRLACSRSRSTARPGHTAEELEKAIDEELDDASRQRRRTQRKSSARATASRRSIISGLETLGGFGGVADRLNSTTTTSATPTICSRTSRAIAPSTPATVKAFAQTN